MSSRFVALRMRPANIGLRCAATDHQTELPVRWLLAEWPAGADAPSDYWLSSLPADTPLAELVRLGKLRWRIEHDYRELKDALGLDHFEGRSYRGWHHHVTLSMLGTVGFAVAFFAGVMYLTQDGLLKSKRFNVLYAKLPALDYLDHLNQQSIVMGFPLLTLGIISGAFSAEIARGTYVNWNPEQTWAMVTWGFYFAVLVGRLTIGWRAKRAAYLTIIGFAGVILTLIGVVLKSHGSVS